MENSTLAPLTSLSNVLNGGVKPEGEQYLRRYRRSPCAALSRFDSRVQTIEVLLHDIAPYEPRPMPLGQQRLKVAGT